MKKIYLLVMTSFYLIASSGAMVCAHHLKKIFSETTQQITENHQIISCCHSSNKIVKLPVKKKDGCQDGCCKNGHCSIKVKSDGFTEISFSFKLFSHLICESTWATYQIPLISPFSMLVPDYHAPPNIYCPPLYLQYQSFRI